jgi:DNA-binding transcriptional regulator YhcF (GntR family)
VNINFETDRPIYLELSDWIEDNILSGVFKEETQIPSTTELSVNFKINPATALKGINILVDQGIIYKKRGVGMFVSEGAVEAIRGKRKQEFYDAYINSLLSEASKLNISKEEIIEMIERGFDK